MFVIVGIILSLIEIKEALKDKKIRAILFFTFMIIVLILYIYKEKIPSIMYLITKIKELINE